MGSTVGGLEGAWEIGTGTLTSMSEQQFVDCSKANSGCNGGLMDSAFQYAEGVPALFRWCDHQRLRQQFGPRSHCCGLQLQLLHREELLGHILGQQWLREHCRHPVRYHNVGILSNSERKRPSLSEHGWSDHPCFLFCRLYVLLMQATS